MKPAAVVFALCMMLPPQWLHADQFNLSLSVGGDSSAFPNNSKGFLIVDAAGDGFQFLTTPSLLVGALAQPAGTVIGADDVIFAVNLPLVDFGLGKLGFSLPNTLFDSSQIPSLIAGKPFAIVWFPAGTSATGDGFNFYRSDTFNPTSGATSGFQIPAAGATDSVIAVGSGAGGNVTTSQFTAIAGILGTPSPSPTPNPAPIKFADFVRTYTSSFGKGDTTHADQQEFWTSNGLIVLTTTKKGAVSGKLFLEGQTFSFNTKLDALTGQATVVIPRKSKTSVTLAMTLKPTSPASLEGTLTTDGSPITFKAKPPVFSGKKNDVHPFNKARFTVVLPDSEASFGHGYLTIAFTKPDGTVQVLGKVADNTVVTATVQSLEESPDNWLIPLFAPIASGSGMLKGNLLLPKVPVSGQPEVETGNPGLGWLRLANSKDKVFPAGFLKQLSAVGSRYILAKNVSLISGNSTTAGFSLVLDPSASVLPAAITQAGSWPKTNVPLLTKPVTASLKLTFTAVSGVIKGTFKRVIAGKAVSIPYEGVILSSPQILPGGTSPVHGAGFFSTGPASGPIEIK